MQKIRFHFFQLWAFISAVSRLEYTQHMRTHMYVCGIRPRPLVGLRAAIGERGDIELGWRLLILTFHFPFLSFSLPLTLILLLRRRPWLGLVILAISHGTFQVFELNWKAKGPSADCPSLKPTSGTRESTLVPSPTALVSHSNYTSSMVRKTNNKPTKKTAWHSTFFYSI